MKLLAVLGLVLWPSLAGVAIAADSGTAAQEAVSLLREYVQIDTTNPPGNEINAARFFKAIFDREGIESRIFESAPGRANIYARLKGDGSKKNLVLLNHMDVVPADKQFWSVAPFAAVVKDGYIWGRGVADMKGMAIVELMAMLTLKRQGIPLKGDVVFLGVADEEAGGAMGAGYMLREHFDLLKDAGTVVNEVGFISADKDGKILYYEAETTQKVPLWLKLTATGKAGHGAWPRPDSAVTTLLAALQRIANYRTPLKVEPAVQQYYADTAELDPSPDNRVRLRDLATALQDPTFAAEFTADVGDNTQVRNTIAITKLEGSNKINVIPSAASAELDIRLLPSEDPKQFIDQLRTVIGDDMIKIETLLSRPASSSPQSEFLQVLQGVADERNPGIKVRSPMNASFTDCHYFRVRGIPCYGFTPFKDSEAGGLHGVDEKLSLANVKLGTEILYELVLKLAAE
jgi:acetylornithine deacetylase/succinyl-diaminopimelate desuccinylase-like protein